MNHPHDQRRGEPDPWDRVDCIKYVRRLKAEGLKMAGGVFEFILDRLATCRDPEGNMLRMLNETRGAKGSWNQRHQPERANVIPDSLLRQQIVSASGGKPCDHCGQEFRPTRSDARHCGAACRKAAQRGREQRDREQRSRETVPMAMAA